LCVPCPAKTKADPTNRSCIPETKDGKKPTTKKQMFDAEKRKRTFAYKDEKWDNFDRKKGKRKEAYVKRKADDDKRKKAEEEKKKKEEEERKKKEQDEKDKRDEKKRTRSGWYVYSTHGDAKQLEL
jgi:hypothetical protein